MFSRFKSNLVNMACSMGGFSLAKLLTGNQPKILMYHRFCDKKQSDRVAAEIFNQQMAELKGKFNVQPLSRICSLIREHKPVPRNSIVITVDDGYEDFYRVAYPILKKYGLPATVYITVDFIEGKLWLWPDKVTHILNNSSKDKLTINFQGNSKRKLSLRTASDRAVSWAILIDHCLTLGEEERLDFIDSLAVDLGVTIGSIPDKEFAPMTWDNVMEISDNGIEIGAHSCSHPVLSRLNPEKLRDEITGSKNRLENAINRPVTAFCYPNGQPADYDEEVKHVIIDSSYSSATVAFHDKYGWNDLFEIRRHGVGNDLRQFRKATYGVESLSDLIQ